MGLRGTPPVRGCRMGLIFAENTRPFCRNGWNLPFQAVLLFAVWLTGCNNTCFTFTSNPPTGTIDIKASDPSPSCTLTKANGAIRLTLRTVPMCSSCLGSSSIQHMFVSIQGIELNPSSTARDDSPDWQEVLSPELAEKPLEVDLVKGTADQSVQERLGETAPFPAGIYRQVRLRFAPNQPATDDRLLEKNECGSGKFNCIVMADGRIQSFQLDGASPVLRITSDRIDGSSLAILPDTVTDLVIELEPVWALFSSAHEGVRLLPVLTGSAKVGRIEFDRLGAQMIQSFTLPSQSRRATELPGCPWRESWYGWNSTVREALPLCPRPRHPGSRRKRWHTAQLRSSRSRC